MLKYKVMIKRIGVFIILCGCLIASLFVLTPVINVFADDDACSIAGFDDPLLCGTKGSDEEAADYKKMYDEFHYKGWGMRRWYNFKKSS